MTIFAFKNDARFSLDFIIKSGNDNQTHVESKIDRCRARHECVIKVIKYVCMYDNNFGLECKSHP